MFFAGTLDITPASRSSSAILHCPAPRQAYPFAQAIAARASASIVSATGKGSTGPAATPNGISVHPGTPAPIRARLGEVIRAALTDPTVIADFQRRGLEAWPSTEAAFTARLAADAAKWHPLILAAGIEPT
jgi:tripartite-type tricarboxylate transporter receptor subunit TctC